MLTDRSTRPTESPPVAPGPPSGSETDKADGHSPSEDGQLSPAIAHENEDDNKSPQQSKDTSRPPLPDEDAPPLPNEDAPPLPQEDVPQDEDGWDPVWDPNAQAYYFYNRHTQVTQWENPRVPDSTAPGVANHDRTATTTDNNDPKPPRRPTGGYDPSIHGDYDPNADYAQTQNDDDPSTADGISGPLAAGNDNPDPYSAAATFNRFTGRFQASSLTSESFNDENRSKRQMNAYFDVDAAANAHDGKSLRAERSAKKLSRKELSAFKKKRKEKKEERRRAWLRD